jgi:hypothetical protein
MWGATGEYTEEESIYDEPLAEEFGDEYIDPYTWGATGEYTEEESIYDEPDAF